jgi:predicted RecA/RadA family phage recombinase
MATNFVSDGKVIELTAPVGGVVSGSLYKIGSWVVVATVTAAAGAKFNGGVEGIWLLPKTTAEPWTEGMAVYFNTSTSLASSVSTGGNVLIGGSVAAAVNPSTTCAVRLNGKTV